MMYASVVTRDSKNNQITGRAQYRVVEAEAIDETILHKNGIHKRAVYLKGRKKLVIFTNKPYRVGNLISPTKALRYAMRVKG